MAKSKEAKKVAMGLHTVSPAAPVGCHRVNAEDVVSAGVGGTNLSFGLKKLKIKNILVL